MCGANLAVDDRIETEIFKLKASYFVKHECCGTSFVVERFWRTEFYRNERTKSRKIKENVSGKNYPALGMADFRKRFNQG